MEFLITFVLIFTVFASTDSKRTDLGGSTPLTVGLAVGVCHLWAVSVYNTSNSGTLGIQCNKFI